MLYAYTETPDEAERAVVARIEALQRDLRHFVIQRLGAGPASRADDARQSPSCVQQHRRINVSQRTRGSRGRRRSSGGRQENWRAVLRYQEAMTYILQRCRDHDFRFSVVHPRPSFHHLAERLDANPGNFRRGWVGVQEHANSRDRARRRRTGTARAIIDELVDISTAPRSCTLSSRRQWPISI